VNKVVFSTNLNGFKLFKRGKVRDVYDLGKELLLISTDRISCFDVVLPDCVPHKGEILTRLSAFWFGFTQDIIPNHLVTTDVEKFRPELSKYKEELRDRSMLTVKAQAIPFECVVRGYLSGSGWKEYQQSSSICGIKLPRGLRESQRFPQPIFTPATKEENGHDQNISYEDMEKDLGADLFRQLKDLSIVLYQKASQYAETRGIIIADTKFEFGFHQGQLMLIDEALTPDSSRFWPKDRYQPGKPQPSFDKQFVRDYLETLDWGKTPPAPRLPPEILEETSRLYREICRLLLPRPINF